jgi:hypothetical protein
MTTSGDIPIASVTCSVSSRGGDSKFRELAAPTESLGTVFADVPYSGKIETSIFPIFMDLPNAAIPV